MYYRVALLSICMSIAQLYGQQKDSSITIEFIGENNQPAGSYQMTVEQVKKLAKVSRTFADDKESSTAGIIRLNYISKKQFELILSMIDQLENVKKLEALVNNLSINKLYDLYKVVAFLDIEQLVDFMKKHIESLVATTSPTILASITLADQNGWFKDAVTARREFQIVPKETMFTLVFKNNEIIEKPLSEETTLQKLISISETLKNMIEDTGGLSSQQPLYLYGISKKSFELLYELVSTLHDANTFTKKLETYSLIQLGLVANAADYLESKKLLDAASTRLTQGLLTPESLKLYKDGRAWGTFLGLNPLTDHEVALALSDQLALHNQVYLFKTLPDQNEIIFSAALSLDGKTLAYGLSNGSIKLWDIVNKKFLKTINNPGDIVRSIAFSPDGTKIAFGSSDGSIKLWNLVNNELMHTVTGNTGTIVSVTFSPDGTKIAYGSSNKTITLWDVSSEDLITTLTDHTSSAYSVAFSPDGKILASGLSDSSIKLWDAVNGTLLQNVTGHKNTVNSIAFSPDGTKIVSASWDKTIKLWNVESGKLIKTLMGYTNVFYGFVFNFDGIMIALRSKDKTIKLWRTITLNDLRDLRVDQALLIALAQQEHQAGRSLVLTQRLNIIFESLNEPLKKLLTNLFAVKRGK